LRRLKEHVTQWQWSPDEATLRSRQVLQRFCFEEHEADNQRLIEMLGWKIDHLVPPTPDDEDAIAEPSIAELDQLWNPRHSTAELQLLLTAVDAALAGSPLDNRPETVAGWRQVAFRVRRTAHRRHAGLGS
jgi:hypothetical protein